MSDPQRRYVCKACAQVHPTWSAMCKNCKKFGLEVQQIVPEPTIVTSVPPMPPQLTVVPDEAPTKHVALVEASNAPIALADVEVTSFVRDPTGLQPFDDVLGGGLVVGSVVALGGPPGGGKSSIIMQVLDGLRLRALIATGEETIAQAADRARRIRAAGRKVSIVAETDLDRVLEHARTVKAEVLLVDSIQTMTCAEVSSAAGSVEQVKICTNRLVSYCKAAGTPGSPHPNPMAAFLICHVTQDGKLAGPRTLKHMVDVVLEFEVSEGNVRTLRCANKNRFGDTTVIGRFLMTAIGLVALTPEEALKKMQEAVKVPNEGSDEEDDDGGEGPTEH